MENLIGDNDLFGEILIYLSLNDIYFMRFTCKKWFIKLKKFGFKFNWKKWWIKCLTEPNEINYKNDYYDKKNKKQGINSLNDIYSIKLNENFEYFGKYSRNYYSIILYKDLINDFENYIDKTKYYENGLDNYQSRFNDDSMFYLSEKRNQQINIYRQSLKRIIWLEEHDFNSFLLYDKMKLCCQYGRKDMLIYLMKKYNTFIIPLEFLPWFFYYEWDLFGIDLNGYSKLNNWDLINQNSCITTIFKDDNCKLKDFDEIKSKNIIKNIHICTNWSKHFKSNSKSNSKSKSNSESKINHKYGINENIFVYNIEIIKKVKLIYENNFLNCFNIQFDKSILYGIINSKLNSIMKKNENFINLSINNKGSKWFVYFLENDFERNGQLIYKKLIEIAKQCDWRDELSNIFAKYIQIEHFPSEDLLMFFIKQRAYDWVNSCCEIWGRKGLLHKLIFNESFAKEAVKNGSISIFYLLSTKGFKISQETYFCAFKNPLKSRSIIKKLEKNIEDFEPCFYYISKYGSEEDVELFKQKLGKWNHYSIIGALERSNTERILRIENELNKLFNKKYISENNYQELKQNENNLIEKDIENNVEKDIEKDVEKDVEKYVEKYVEKDNINTIYIFDDKNEIINSKKIERNIFSNDEIDKITKSYIWSKFWKFSSLLHSSNSICWDNFLIAWKYFINAYNINDFDFTDLLNQLLKKKKYRHIIFLLNQKVKMNDLFIVSLLKTNSTFFTILFPLLIQNLKNNKNNCASYCIFYAIQNNDLQNLNLLFKFIIYSNQNKNLFWNYWINISKTQSIEQLLNFYRKTINQ